ncbi:thioredoxin [Prolixibacteraceae bacterium JC049]|jgi:thioredoxin 1|nr:thioredoxin [Prolixibacteraceae bacterium JC049]
MSKFQTLINSEQPVLVDFYANWCAPCKMMTPILQQVSQEIGDAGKIIKIDVDSNPEAAAQYGVQSIPTLILFKKGEIVWRGTGVKQTDYLKKLMEEHI